MGEKKPTGLRHRRREGTIEGIVDAALEVLLEEGYEALTISKVAERVEYAVSAIYRYFESKDDLMVAAQRRVLEELRRMLDQALGRIDEALAHGRAATPSKMTLTRLMAVPLVHERIAVERPAFFALLSLSIATPKELMPRDRAIPSMTALMGLNVAIARLFDEASSAGVLSQGPAQRRAVVLWGAHHGILQLRKLGRFGLPPLAVENLSRDTLKPLIVGWGAEPREFDDAYERARKILGEPSG